MLGSFSLVLDWLVDAVPRFLSSEPIVYFVGLIFCFAIIALLKAIINITR